MKSRRRNLRVYELMKKHGCTRQWAYYLYNREQAKSKGKVSHFRRRKG